MHIAQRKELYMHKTKQKRDKNRTTTSLVLDSSMQSGRWEFRQNQRIWLRLSSVFESRRISFFQDISCFFLRRLGPSIFVFVCFVALRPKSTAMVMAGRSIHLTTLFSWASFNKQLTSTSCTYFGL